MVRLKIKDRLDRKRKEKDRICISAISHSPVMPAMTSLSNNRSPKYLRLSL